MDGRIWSRLGLVCCRCVTQSDLHRLVRLAMPGVTNEGVFKDLLAVVDVGPPELKASAIQLFVHSTTPPSTTSTYKSTLVFPLDRFLGVAQPSASACDAIAHPLPRRGRCRNHEPGAAQGRNVSRAYRRYEPACALPYSPQQLTRAQFVSTSRNSFARQPRRQLDRPTPAPGLSSQQRVVRRVRLAILSRTNIAFAVSAI